VTLLIRKWNSTEEGPFVPTCLHYTCMTI